MKRTDELQEFVNSSGEVPAGVQSELDRTEKTISAELKRSSQRFFFAFIGLSFVGYFCSLSVCSQYSIALTNFSLSVASVLHQLPDPWCPIVCGIVFSILPVVSLFVFLDRFQRRRLIVQYWWLPVLTTLFSCLLMALLPQSMQHSGMHVSHHGLRHLHGDFVWLMWWTLSAMSIPLAFSVLARFRVSSSMRRNVENL